RVAAGVAGGARGAGGAPGPAPARGGPAGAGGGGPPPFPERARPPPLAATLHELVRDPRLGGMAVRGLSAYDDPATPEVLIKAYPDLGPLERRDALNSLASRKTSARSLLSAVAAGRLPRVDLTADLIRQLRNLNDPELPAQI